MKTWQTVLRAAGFPDQAMVLDFESYFDKDYTLKKMSTIEYVTDERFELTGLGLSDIGGQTEFVTPGTVEDYIDCMVEQYGHGLRGLTVVTQNANFDCMILRHHFGITPKYIVDLMDLDKMWDARDRHGLEHMAKKWYALWPKLDTEQALGLHWADMRPTDRIQWIKYTKRDIDIEKWLFKKMMPIVVSRPEIELPIANLTHQMYLEPTFVVDSKLGKEIVEGMKAEMQKPVDRLRRRGVQVDKGKKTLEKTINSNLCFCKLLLDAGVEIPVKPGKPTKNMIPMTGEGLIPALAKDDDGMFKLLHHEKPHVRRLAEAKQSLQSWPLHIRKVENIMRQAKCRGNRIGTPLGYHNAHNGRWGGIEKINLQNLGGAGRGGKGTHGLIKRVRNMLRAPKGYMLGIQDYSKVEAVGAAWQAGQSDLIEGFRTGADVYSELATELFGHPVHKPTGFESPEEEMQLTVERGFGKDAILGCGYGMGADTFYDRCYANPELKPKFDDGTFDIGFIRQVIQTYRKKYSKIPSYWQKLEQNWRIVTKYTFDKRRLPECGLEFWHDGGATFIRLPSGRTLRYPNAKVKRSSGECSYRWGYLWGGVLTENVVSGLCRDFIAESMLKLKNAGFWVVLTVHDEIVTFLPEAHADEQLEEMGQIMCDLPDWAKGFPLTVEGKLSETYCK